VGREEELSAVLVEFARTLVTDFPIQSILDHLVERIVDVLPVSSAGVTLIAPGKQPRYVAASDEAALRYEVLQTEVAEGPCVAAYESGESVAIPDLRLDTRFPTFTPRALSAGLAAVFTFPLRQEDRQLGALDLYRETPGDLDAHDMEAAQTLADVATAYLLNAQGRAEARETADSLRHSALHDPLTGLPNRALLQERLEHAALRARRSHTQAAVLFADLDRFKSVNDTYGHQIGDELLVAVAHRLQALLRSGDTLARVSGDEFVILCEDLRDAAHVEVLAMRIHEAFQMPFLVSGKQLAISASIGIAFAGDAEDISRELIRVADAAMYEAKRDGGAGHQISDYRSTSANSSRFQLQRDLQDAFAREEFEVVYQPIVRSLDGLVTGVEALLRWTHHDRGPMAPQTLVAVAEQSGLIAEIGAWVLERACRNRLTWLQQDPDVSIDVAVNVSAGQFMGADFSATASAVLEETGMDPAALVLEITEGVLIADRERAKNVLASIKSLGVKLALDDFGTGYSSLSHLRQFPVDMVKIDRGFITDIGQDPASTAIISAVTNLAHELGLSVVAEGVETRRQQDEVVAVGCEGAQGFFYSKPISAQRMTEWFGSTAGRSLHLPIPQEEMASASPALQD
jgi:diguanylate cyclase (GGDEF)-like protein